MKKLAVVTAIIGLGIVAADFSTAVCDDSKSTATAEKQVIQLAQKKDATSKAAKKPATRKKPEGRLPNNYGKLGISSKQRADIYKIQAKYRTELEELKKQMQLLVSLRNTEVEDVLTAIQKQQLAKLVEASKNKRKKTSGKPKASKAK